MKLLEISLNIMAKNKSDVFIICGERSGDLHGSQIVKKLLSIDESSVKLSFLKTTSFLESKTAKQTFLGLINKKYL